MTEQDAGSSLSTGNARATDSSSAINNSVNISGSTVTGMAVGNQNSHLTVNQGAPDEQRLGRLEQLLAQLEAGAGALGDRSEQFLRDVAELRDAARAGKRDQSRISELLAGLTVLTAPVAALLSIVKQVKDLFR